MNKYGRKGCCSFLLQHFGLEYSQTQECSIKMHYEETDFLSCRAFKPFFFLRTYAQINTSKHCILEGFGLSPRLLLGKKQIKLGK